MAIVFGFQVLVDGWLTKRSAPIVLDDDDQTTGIRFPWDIPIEAEIERNAADSARALAPTPVDAEGRDELEWLSRLVVDRDR